MEIKITRQIQTFMENYKTDNWKLDCGIKVSRHSSVAGSCGVATSYFATEYSINRTSMLRKKQRRLVCRRTVCLSPDFMMVYCSAR
jgi:hypothetical protein